ncbi:hypothetical protein ABFX02_13G003600 [Erythranthe guttata]
MDSQIERRLKKSKHQNDDADEPIISFDELPSEILTDVLSRLPITSLIQSTFVWTSLKPLSNDPNLVNMHLSRSSTNNSLCLILHSDLPIQNQLHFVRVSGDSKVRKIGIPFEMSMPEFKILGSSNGLLCLLNTLFTESICLYNPFTRDHFALPKSYDFQDQVVVYGFGSHPVTKDYKVIKVVYYTISFFRRLGENLRHFNQYFKRRIESEVKIYSHASKMWRNYGQIPHRLEQWSSPGVLSNGCLHWFRALETYRAGEPLRRTIVSYDLADDSFRVMYTPSLYDVCPSMRRGIRYLDSLNGCLCAYMPAGRGAVDVWVMKEYGVTESWVKQYTIGSYIPGSVVCDENGSGMPSVRVLCVLESGEVLLKRKQEFICYDPYKERFKELNYRGMPRSFRTIVHVGSLKSAASPWWCKNLKLRTRVLLCATSSWILSHSIGNSIITLSSSRFVFVLQGNVVLSDALFSRYKLEVDSYAYIPKNTVLWLKSDTSATLVVFERRFLSSESFFLPLWNMISTFT